MFHIPAVLGLNQLRVMLLFLPFLLLRLNTTAPKQLLSPCLEPVFARGYLLQKLANINMSDPWEKPVVPIQPLLIFSFFWKHLKGSSEGPIGPDPFMYLSMWCQFAEANAKSNFNNCTETFVLIAVRKPYGQNIPKPYSPTCLHFKKKFPDTQI